MCQPKDTTQPMNFIPKGTLPKEESSCKNCEHCENKSKEQKEKED